MNNNNKYLIIGGISAVVLFIALFFWNKSRLSSDGAVPGVLSSWSDWSGCSKTCGGGTQARTRTYTEPKYGGAHADDYQTLEETRVCNSDSCPVPGALSTWSDWTGCSKTCGGGIQKRIRTYTQPQYGGAHVDGYQTLEETRACNLDPCPVPGVLSSWSEWSNCSKTCGGGTQTRSRTYIQPQHGGVHADGYQTLAETRACNTDSCPVSKVQEFLQNNFTASKQENFTEDNLNYIQHFYKTILDILPADVQKRALCETITRENATSTIRCLLMQTGEDFIKNRELMIIAFVSFLTVFSMVDNSKLEPIDILEYNPTTQSIFIKDDNLRFSRSIDVKLEINGKLIDYAFSKTSNDMNTAYSLDFNKAGLPIPESGEMTLDVKYDGQIKQLQFRHSTLPPEAGPGAKWIIGPSFMAQFGKNIDDFFPPIVNLNEFLDSLPLSAFSTIPSQDCLCMTQLSKISQSQTKKKTPEPSIEKFTNLGNIRLRYF
jgi:hypothetical protein